MILDTELNEEREFRVKSYCDSCEKTYWSSIEEAVEDVEIETSNYEYTVSVCPDCTNKYDLSIRFAILNDGLDELLKAREALKIEKAY